MITWITKLFEGKRQRKVRTILNEEQKEYLVIDYSINGVSIKDCATKYDVSYSCASSIIRNKMRANGRV